MKNSKSKIPALEQLAFMHQFPSMFLQFVIVWTSELKSRPYVKYAQVSAISEEVVQAVTASMQEWQEISRAEQLGKVAFRSAEWITFDELFIVV